METIVKGCDPEVFLCSHDGTPVSSIGRIGGTKMEPLPIDGDGNAVQEDNVAVEFNTPPCHTVEDYIKHIRTNLSYITDRATEQGLLVNITPSLVFPDDELRHPDAKVFGCEPDYNAYKDGEPNPRPRADDANLRSAGGHIHVQIDDPDMDIHDVVKAMDVFVSLPLMRHDKDTRRRSLYGKPGAYRKKPYGVEYRTPSNVWITSDELIRMVWSDTDRAVDYVKNGGRVSPEQGVRIQRAINTSNMELAEELMAEFGV